MKRFPIHIIGLLILLSALTGCGKKEAPAEPQRTDTTRLFVMQVTEQSRLYTSELQIHKLITHSDNRKLRINAFGSNYDVKQPFSDRCIAIPIDVTLKAYIDFSEFSEANVIRTDSTLHVVLPDPVIVMTASRVDQKGIRQYNDIGRSTFSDAEIASFQRQGADSIKAHLGQYGIIKEAQASAARLLVPMLKRLGYDERGITVTFRKEKFTGRELQEMLTLEKQ